MIEVIPNSEIRWIQNGEPVEQSIFNRPTIDLLESLNERLVEIDTNIDNLTKTTVTMTSPVVDLSAGTVLKYTVTGSTSFSVTNASPVSLFVLELTNGGSHPCTFMNNTVSWANGTKPTLTTGVDILLFYTTNNGVSWRGFKAALDSRLS